MSEDFIGEEPEVSPGVRRFIADIFDELQLDDGGPNSWELLTKMRTAKVLDYHDVLLRGDDLELVKGPFWLNDQVIAFYFEYLTREKYAGQEQMLFVPGALSYLIATLGASGAADVAAPLKVGDRELLFFAVNDNPDAGNAGGGTHWSLLVYNVADNVFRHYSFLSQATNETSAAAIAAAVQPLLRSEEVACVKQCAVPRQKNGWDCGMFVLATADAIAKHSVEGGAIDELEAVLKRDVTPEAVDAMRQSLRQLIEDKADSAIKARGGKVNAHNSFFKYVPD